MLVVVVLVRIVAMLAVDVVEVPAMRQGLVPAICAMNVHVACVRRVDINFAIRDLLPRFVVDGWPSGGCACLHTHGFIIGLCARDGQVVEDFAA
jgi:hypothetical protein